MFTPEAIDKLAKAEHITATNAAITEVGLAVVPNDVKLTDLEVYQDTRRRMRGIMTTTALPDFAEYVGMHASEDGAAVFVDAAEMRARAVLNLGNISDPGHCDNIAVFAPPKTAAFNALMAVTKSGVKVHQRTLAEFIEDWQSVIQCRDDNGLEIQIGAAVTSVRAITIESAQSITAEAQQLSAAASTFESVQAGSKKGALPSFIDFRCKPNTLLGERTFTMRLGISTAEKEPRVMLTIIKAEEHFEQMGDEMAAKVREAISDTLVIVGTLSA